MSAQAACIIPAIYLIRFAYKKCQPIIIQGSSKNITVVMQPRGRYVIWMN
jgi:hypothetical protein